MTSDVTQVPQTSADSGYVSNRIKAADGTPVGGSGSSRAIEPVRRAAGAAATDKPVEAGNESVHITSSARELLALQQTIKNLPEIDSGRVDRLRRDIEQQRYSVNAEKVASRLLQLEGDLSAAQGRKR